MDLINDLIARLDTATVLAWSWKILAALLIFVIGRWIARLIVRALKKLMDRRGLDPMLVNFLGSILNAILLVAIVIAAISQLGVETTPLVAVLGAAGLAVGLALQGSLSNFASGVMLVLFRPFTNGDFVEAGGTSCSVDEVGMFNTVMTTPDNRRVIVPNGQITTSTITNFSANDTRRIDLVIGVDYSDDLKRARAVMEQVIADHPQVLKEPAPAVLLLDLADSSVNFAVRPWVATPDYWQVRNELLEQLKAELEAAGCSIPFPQRDVHLRHAEGAGPAT